MKSAPIPLISQLEALIKQPSLDNAANLKREIQKISENLQFIQDLVIPRVLTILDALTNENETKTVLIQCINLILERSKIQNELPYKTILCIILKQIYDYPSNSYNKHLSEEIKIEIFRCFELASRNLDKSVVLEIMIDQHKTLFGQCIFVCIEAIVKETYIKLRQSAIDAVQSIMQLHSKADFNDIVLRDQISKILFIVLPKVVTVLSKVCREETLRGPHLVEASLRTLGRFLCLILEDYEKKSNTANADNDDFRRLVSTSGKEISEKLSNEKKDITKVMKNDEWMKNTSENLAKLIPNLKPLRSSQYLTIRTELAEMSFILLDKCYPNVQPFAKFLLENLIYACGDEELSNFSRKSIQKLSEKTSNINQEKSDLFSSHLIAMPRLILMGLEDEQIAGLSLLKSFLLLDKSLLENQILLEKFIKILLSCCEMDVANELILYETTNLDNNLSDDFYKLKMPWKKFKNFKSDLARKKFSEVCKNIRSNICINYILDNINSLNYLVLIIEILNCEEMSLEQGIIQNVIEEFLNENYWRMEIELPKEKKFVREEWFKDDITSIEMKLTDIKFDDERQDKLNLKAIRYNILCTCFVTELIGSTSLQLGTQFQPFILRCLHRVLEKAGNSHFLIRSAGLYSINCITKAMGFEEAHQLINEHSDFLLFNIQNLLKRNYENESFLDMISVIFKFSKTSIASYVEDIIETAASHLANDRSRENSCAFLKLFNLYALSLKRDCYNDIEIDEKMKEFNEWKNFASECLFELKRVEEETEFKEENENENSENVIENENSGEEKPQQPLHTKLILQILTSSLPFFASSNPSEVILTHEIFQNSLPILHQHDDTNFLPTIHQMWYPFTKQFQGANYVILSHSIRLLKLITSLAKDFVYSKSTENIFPVINKFLISSMNHQGASYTQEFKLQKEILSGYGQLLVDLGVDDEQLDKIINILLNYVNHKNEQLKLACQISIEALSRHDQLLINYKLMKF